MVKDLKNIYISKKGKGNIDIDIDKIYDNYAKEVLTRKGYPLRATYKAKLLYEFSSPIVQKISSIADIGGCYGYCLAQFQKLYKQKKQVKIRSAVYELGKEYLIRGPKIFPEIDFIHSDKMGDKKYDLILLCDVLEHVTDYNKFLGEIRNISQKHVLIWSPIELTILHKILIRLKLMPKIKWGEEHPEKHVNFWDIKETINILNNHFKILKIGYATGKHMTERNGREIPSSRRSILKKIFYSSMKYVPDYFYLRLIGGHLMVLCEVSDPKASEKRSENVLLGNYIKCYSGYATDDVIRYNASSGGLITALLTFALEKGIINGALVVRMKKDKPLEPETFIARTKKEIIEASGSKYCFASADIALKEIINSKQGEKFAVVGLPCHILRIKEASQVDKNLKEKIAIYLGLFCNHTPNSHGMGFLLKKFNIKQKEIIKIDYRGEGWPGYFKIFKKNGQIVKYPHFLCWSIIGSSFFYSKRCLMCDDGTSELADISFGDAWLPEFKKDKIGRSLILCRTQKGETMLKQAQNEGIIKLEPISFKKVIYSHITTLYFKKKAFKSLFGSSREKELNPDSIDHLFSLFFLLNTALFKRTFFRKLLRFLPIKFFSFYNGFLNIIYYKKARHDFKKYYED